MTSSPCIITYYVVPNCDLKFTTTRRFGLDGCILWCGWIFQRMVIQMKSTEQCLAVVLLQYYVLRGSYTLGVSGWNRKILSFKWKLVEVSSCGVVCHAAYCFLAFESIQCLLRGKKKQKTNVSTAECLAKTFDILEQIRVKSLRIFKKYSKLARNGSRSLPLRVEELLEDNMGWNAS